MKIEALGDYAIVERLECPDVWLHMRMGIEKKSLCWAVWDPAQPAGITEIVSCRFSTSTIALSRASGDLFVPMNNEVFSFNPAAARQTTILLLDEQLCVGNLWSSPDGAELIFATHRQTPSRQEIAAQIREQTKKDPAKSSWSHEIKCSDYRLWRFRIGTPRPLELFKIPGTLAYGAIDWRNNRAFGSAYPNNRFFKLDLSTGAIEWTSIPKMHDISLSPDGRVFAWSPWAPGISELFADSEPDELYLTASAPSFSSNGSWIFFEGSVLRLAGSKARADRILSLPIENDSNLYLRHWCPCGDHVLVFNNQGAPGVKGVAIDARRRQIMALPADFICSGTWYSREMLSTRSQPRTGVV